MRQQSAIIHKPSLGIRPLAAAITSCLRCSIGITMLAGSGLASAATFQVTNLNDAGAGSLRQAVLNANASLGADLIVFNTSVSGTVNLTSGPLELLDSVTVTGPGAATLAIDADDVSEIFLITDAARVSPVELSISGLTLSNATKAISAEVVSIHPVVSVVDCTLSGTVESAIAMSGYLSDTDLHVSRSVLTANDKDAIRFFGTRNSGRNYAAFEDVTISNNGRYGVLNVGANIGILSSEISGNGTGLAGRGDYYSYASFDVVDSVIADNLGNGISLGDVSMLSLEKSSVKDNGGAGVFAGPKNRTFPTISASTIAGNGAGGVDLDLAWSVVAIVNSTLSGNTHGFGLKFDSTRGSAAIENSTIASNASGGIADVADDQIAKEVVIANSIVAGNGAGAGADLSDTGLFAIHHSLVQDPGNASITDSIPGSNIMGADPLLGPLQNNGGSTPTHALLIGSPALDRGEAASCAATDQRGIIRPQDGDGDGVAACDMGAYERTKGSGVIGDWVWRDDDGDGVQDPNEPGMPGVTVNLRINCDPATIISTTTNANGGYRFENLPVGNYQLEFLNPVGYSFSPMIAAGDFKKDSNANPSTGLDKCRSLKEGRKRLALDAGLIP